uniref:Uncharacterized protein n=1 Tax=Anguilla anguilla TaxID=7936 RepID=A0A0E9RL99_ANGAN
MCTLLCKKFGFGCFVIFGKMDGGWVCPLGLVPSEVSSHLPQGSFSLPLLP